MQPPPLPTPDHLPVLLLTKALMLGMICLASAAIGLFFLRFWRRTRDPLFLTFAIAFVLMGFSFGAHAFIPSEKDKVPLYALRLATYAFILLGIIAKNRSGAPRTP